MAGREPEHRVRWPVMRQAWRDVVFVHWPYSPDEITAQLPRGLAADTWNGTAWVALSAFRVAACGLGPLSPLSRWTFPETNLRTYVLGPEGTDGIWFLTIDAETLSVTVGARLGFGALYHHAAMHVHRGDDDVRYTSHRHGTAPIDAGHDFRIRIDEPVTDSERSGLVDWCTGRWRAWTNHLGLLLRSPVQHQPWPLRRAELTSMEQSLTAAAGLSPPTGTPLVHYSPGVDARLGAPRPTLVR